MRLLKTKEISTIVAAGDVREVLVYECGEPLVQLTSEEHDRVIAYSNAYKEGIPGAIEEVYVRESVKVRLFQLAESLPNDYKLVVWETYTPRALQEHLRQTTLTDISMIAHMTGAGIDVTLADKNGQLLDMGSGLNDDEPEKNQTVYFEQKETLTENELIARDNRRILFEAMASNGFTNNPVDWFHWDYGNRWWAKIKHTDAIYDAIDK